MKKKILFLALFTLIWSVSNANCNECNNKNYQNNSNECKKECTKENYESRISAVLDNYERIKEYTMPYDYLYTHYIKK